VEDISNEDVKDLDETRRLLYMAMLRQRTEKYELAGTLVNALVHHQGIDLSPGRVISRVLGVIEDADEDDMAWMQDQIDKISNQLVD
jgi:superfamily I DNA/RNA helicase